MFLNPAWVFFFHFRSSNGSRRSTATLRSIPLLHPPPRSDRGGGQTWGLEQLEGLSSFYYRHLRHLRCMQRIFRLLAIKIKGFDDRYIIHGKQDRFFALRTIDVLVPRPIGNREAVMPVPFKRLVADDGRALAADNEISRARRMPMLFCVLARSEQLNPTAKRPERVPAGHGVHIFQRNTVVRTAGLIDKSAQLRLDVFPGITQRQILLLGVFPCGSHDTGTLLQVIASIFADCLNCVTGIGLVKQFRQSAKMLAITCSSVPVSCDPHG